MSFHTTCVPLVRPFVLRAETISKFKDVQELGDWRGLGEEALGVLFTTLQSTATEYPMPGFRECWIMLEGRSGIFEDVNGSARDRSVGRATYIEE